MNDQDDLLAKLNEAVAAANEAEAKVATAQADLVSRSKAVGLLLLEAKKLYPAVKDFEAFLKRVDGLKLSRAYDLLRLAGGRTTDEELRKEARDRKQKSRAKKKLPRPAPALKKPEPVSVTDPHVTESAEISIEQRQAEHAALDLSPELEAEPEIVEDAEAEIKRLKALKAKLKNNDEIDTTASAKALAAFKAACGDLLPKMNADDLQLAIDYFAEAVEVPATELMPELKDAQMKLKIAKAEVAALKRKLAGKLPPRESRAAKWQRLAGEAEHDVEELIAIQQEFQEARDSQPDGLQDGPFAQKCNEICDIDLEGALGMLQEANGVEVPLGFGRD
jgi:hypothetical protein